MITCTRCKQRNIEDIWKHWETHHPEVDIKPKFKQKPEKFDWRKELGDGLAE